MICALCMFSKCTWQHAVFGWSAGHAWHKYTGTSIHCEYRRMLRQNWMRASSMACRVLLIGTRPIKLSKRPRPLLAHRERRKPRPFSMITKTLVNIVPMGVPSRIVSAGAGKAEEVPRQCSPESWQDQAAGSRPSNQLFQSGFHS